MLVKVLEDIIKSRQYDQEDMENKIDIYWAKKKITDKEYEYLCDLLEKYPPIE